MPLLNYTTKIDAWATVTEIQKILAKAGASHFSIKNKGDRPDAVSFTIEFRGTPLNFSLPCDSEGIKKHFQNLKGPERERLVKNGFMARVAENAANIGWRIVKDWIEAQCALIEVGMATIEVVFMPYLIISPDGETLAHRMLEGDGLKKLTYNPQ